jgi:hypothetical protein
MADERLNKLDRVRTLFTQLTAEPFPQMGKIVGEFVLYDALLAGTADSVLASNSIVLDHIPNPDAETVDTMNNLKARTALSNDERDLVNYFDLLTKLRHALVDLCATM